MFSQIKDRKPIEQNFHSVARVMPEGGTSVLGGVKNLAWGFAMAPPSTAHSTTSLIVSIYAYVICHTSFY